MKVFLDANVIVSVLNKEYPLFTFSARLMSLPSRYNIELVTSPVCLAIAFYFSEKKSGKDLARRKIANLIDRLFISGIDHDVVMRTIGNSAIHDFEDGMQYYSARNAHCDYIITEDIGDYYFSDLEVLSTQTFMQRHVLG